LHPKTKQQQKRLSANVRQAKSNRADIKKSPQAKKNAERKPPAKQTGGFLDKLFGGKPPKTAQESIPYREIYRDGICRVTDRLFTKTVVFSDINYHLAQNDDKTQIFESYCDFLNYFDSSVSVQLSFVNRYGNPEEFRRSIDIPLTGDEFDPVRREYADMLKNQLAKGNNGLTKTKYITFGVEADDLKASKLRIERVEADILNNFKTLGVSARSLSGAERLEILHNQFHPDGTDKFRFDWKDRVGTGLSTKDFIAPASFDFRDGRTFRMGEHCGAASFLQILASELTDRMLADFLDIDAPVTVTLHIRSIDQSEAIKTVKRKLSDLDAMKIAEQKKAVRAGYDMDIIPSDLATYGSEAKTLLEDLQNRNERMFLVTVIVLNTAKKKQKLDNDIFAASGVAIFVPFTTCELFQQGEAMYYGLNALSNNLIMASRKELKNPNGLFLGTPGSGKSFAAKREIVNAFLLTKEDIIISDPEAEYFPLVNRLGGQVIKLSPSSSQYINPMDINADYSDDDDPLALKSDFILSLCELIIGGKSGLEPVEKTIIDRCVRLVYRDYLANPDPAKMPILQDLYDLLRKQSEPEAQRLATALEIVRPDRALCEAA
jgi:hypothetical protein